MAISSRVFRVLGSSAFSSLLRLFYLTRHWGLLSLPLLAIAEHSALAEAESHPTPRPNILLIAIDDLNVWVVVMGGNK